MRTIHEVEAQRAQVQEALQGLRRQAEQAQAQATGADAALTAVQEKHRATLEGYQRAATRSTDGVFGLLVVLLAAAVAALVTRAAYFAPMWQAIREFWAVGTVEKAALIGFAVLSVAAGWLLAAGKKKAVIAPLIVWALLAMLLFAVQALIPLTAAAAYLLIWLVLRLVRRLVLGNGRYRNIFERLQSQSALRAAQTDLAAGRQQSAQAADETERLRGEIAHAEQQLTALAAEQRGLETYAAACEMAENYPQAAVKAYGQFLAAYAVLGELGQPFFDLRARMESEDGETMYRFALELSEANGDAYAFLRLLQLAVNQGCEPARTALGGALAQISSAAGAGNYAAAYALLQPLIEAGSTEALTVKLQLDNNRQAEAARRQAEQARKEAAAAAVRQAAQISAAQQAVLGEMAAIRQNQEFGQQMMYYALEDARHRGIKVRFE